MLTRDRTTAPPTVSLVSVWFAAGTLAALFLMATQAMALGGWTSLLAVGEDAAIRPVIETEIPDVVVLPGDGNDGQIYYAIGIEPFDDVYADLLPEASLRWRRILLPVTASVFGAVGGVALFWNTVVIVAISAGVAAASLADIARSMGLARWLPGVFLVHPGVWIGVRLLSPDILALALALAAIALSLRGRNGWTVLLLSLAVLTKEPYLIVAFSLAAWRWFQGDRKAGLALAAVPTAVLVGWSAVVSGLIPGTVFEQGNIALPFAGIIEASRWWPDIEASQNLRTGLALIMVAAGILIGLRHRGHALLHWLLWPWVALAIVTSHWVWRFGNGSLRAFAFIGLVAAMMLASRGRPAALESSS